MSEDGHVVALSGKSPAIGAWLDANLTFLAEFNAARKILKRQLQDAYVGPAPPWGMRATAIDLQTTTLML